MSNESSQGVFNKEEEGGRSEDDNNAAILPKLLR